jgi:hypothetical protein
VRVVDSAGNDFEIWCMQGILSVYYEFRRSFPDGTVVPVDTCELSMGVNDVVLHITGGVTGTAPLPNGGTAITVGGIISKYYHENANSSDDFHHIYDYTTRTLKRINTKAATDEQGRPYRKIQYAVASVVSQSTPSPAVLAWGGGTVSPPPDKKLPVCPSGELEESLRIRAHAVGQSEVFHPKSTPIEEIQHDRNANVLTVVLPKTRDRANALSLAIPRELLPGEGMLSRVAIDGEPVQAEEVVTTGFRTLNLKIRPDSRLVRIEVRETPPIPPAWVPLAYSAGGFLLGILILGVARRLRGRNATGSAS